MNFPVFDLHCDTSLALIGKDLKSNTSLRKNDFPVIASALRALPLPACRSGTVFLP